MRTGRKLPSWLSNLNSHKSVCRRIKAWKHYYQNNYNGKNGQLSLETRQTRTQKESCQNRIMGHLLKKMILLGDQWKKVCQTDVEDHRVRKRSQKAEEKQKEGEGKKRSKIS